LAEFPRLLFVLEVLLDVCVHWNISLVLVLVVGSVGSIAFPSSLLLFPEFIFFLVMVLTLQADAEFATFDALLKAEAVLLLAVGLLAGAEHQIFHTGLICMHLLEVVQILAVFLLDQLQEMTLLVFLLILSFFPL
jgi:hypothetical protein